MKKIVSIFLMIFIIVISFSCKKSKIEISISGESTVEVGCSILLKAEYNGDNNLTWSSDNTSVADVFEGMVVAYKEGVANIFVSDGNLSASKKVTVTPNIIEITINGINSLVIGEEYKFSASLSKDVQDDKIIWSSSDDNVLTVDGKGNVKAVGVGEAKVIASLYGNSSSFTVKVFEQGKEPTPEPVKYVVTFDVDGTKTTAEVLEGEKAVKPLDPVKEGYTFLGWYVGDIAYDFETIIETDITLVAKFEEVKIDDPTNPIVISGVDTILVDEATYFECNYECTWYSSNEDVAFVTEEGEVIGTGEGTAIIYAIDVNNPENIAEKTIVVTAKAPTRISVAGCNKVSIKRTISLEVSVYPKNSSKEVIYISSDESIATVDENGNVTGVDNGVVLITIKSKLDKSVYSTFEIEVILAAPDQINVTGNNTMVQGSHNYLEVEVIGDKITKEVIWKTSDPTIAIVYQGIVLAVNKGNVVISAHSAADTEVCGSIEITVNPYIAEDYSEEEIKKVDEIISKMTLSQKVGQMFVVGFNGTSFSNDLGDVIDQYNFGNVIYMGYNVTNPATLAKLSNDIQQKMVSSNSVPGFITIDQEGGRVARLTNGGTHFISNMAMAATNNFNNTYLEGVAMGKELRNYGINVDFAPVLDVNNNPNNPIIGIRSYSDNPILVSLYGKNMFTGLKESNVMGCSKHFPGHGNTSTDSHYGLPTITSGKDELYQTELAPFISAVANGIDSIMTTHIIFSAIDTKYPATLSEKVLTNLLREELGFNGLIITDGMEMAAVSKNFGDYGTTAVLAVKAGVDILTYTTNTNPRKAHEAIMNEVKNGSITEERINESVRRILLKKLEYGILDGYMAENKDISELLSENNDLNIKFATESLTLVKGDFNGLDKDKSVLMISTSTSIDSNSNSCASYAANYLTSQGYNNVEYAAVSNNISNDDSNYLLEKAKDYDQIVIAMSNVKTNNYSRTINFVNKLAQLDKELLVVALDTPYDLMSYTGVENYVCLYGLQKATVISLSKYLNGEFTAQGKLPISEDVFK